MSRREGKKMTKLRSVWIKVRERILMTLILISTIPMFSASAYASDVQNSKLAKGTEALINDVTTWLMILAPIVAALLIVYFFIRRSAADEMDQKKWNNRIVVAIVSAIGAVLASATLNLIIGYYR